MCWFCQNQDFSFLGENAVGSGDSGYNPGYSGFLNTPGDTPVISPDTPGLGNSGGNSGYRPGNSGLGSPDTPSICLDTPDFDLESHTSQTGLKGLVYRSDRC